MARYGLYDLVGDSVIKDMFKTDESFGYIGEQVVAEMFGQDWDDIPGMDDFDDLGDDLGGGGGGGGVDPGDWDDYIPEDPTGVLQETLHDEVDYVTDSVTDTANHLAKVAALVLGGVVAAGVVAGVTVGALLNRSKRHIKRLKNKMTKLDRRMAGMSEDEVPEKLRKKVKFLKNQIAGLNADVQRLEAHPDVIEAVEKEA